MTRKFLFCFPLRLGNIVFGYIVIIISLAVVIFHLYQLGLDLVSKDDERNLDKFGNFDKLESIFGTEKKDMVTMVTMIYYLTYIVIGFLLFVFASIFTCGAYNIVVTAKGHFGRDHYPCNWSKYRQKEIQKSHIVNECLVSTFFVYSFFHLFFTIGLIVWEAVTAGWIQLGLILASDLLLMICLFSVKYLIEAIRNGNIYSRPGDVMYKY